MLAPLFVVRKDSGVHHSFRGLEIPAFIADALGTSAVYDQHEHMFNLSIHVVILEPEESHEAVSEALLIFRM